MADAFDAMTSEGPYGGALTIDDALAELSATPARGSTPPAIAVRAPADRRG